MAIIVISCVTSLIWGAVAQGLERASSAPRYHQRSSGSWPAQRNYYEHS